tara:strand:+ start:2007 stop:3086 length:1080 start_codon:yes stop_codon:yes gene_type:complete
MNSASETILHIDLKKLEKNLEFFKRNLKPKTRIIAVVKAFAYGHGDIEISKRLEGLGVYALWVSDFEEGVVLRKSGVKIKIIVANPGVKSYNHIIQNNLDVVLYNHKLLDLYCTNKKKTNIHIKFDTGMNRYGFKHNDIAKIITKLRANKHLKLDSICSHLAASEDKNKKGETLNQITQFKLIGKEFDSILGKTVNKHILNSNGVVNFNEYQMDGVRIGIGLLGAAKHKELTQISSLVSVITQIKSIKKDEAIGYGFSFAAKKDMIIAVIPVGYADGLNRQLSNGNGHIYINNNKCNIVGKISMDSCMVDVSNVKANEGDQVEIFGPNLSVFEIADKINTIPYEIYSTLNRRIKRVYSD